jgi:uncharacterized membrane protein
MLIILLYVGLVILNAGMLWWFAKLPAQQSEEAFFGFHVSRGVYREQGQRILHRYRYFLTAAFIVIEAIALLASIRLARTSEIAIYSIAFPRIASHVLLALSAIALHIIFARQAAVFEITGERMPVASSLKTRRCGDYTSATFEVVIAILITAPLVWLVSSYPALPERIPWHMNSRGEIDDWLSKSLASIFCLPILLLYAQGWFLLVKKASVQGTMTLPAEHTAEFLRHKEESFRLGVRLLDWLRVIFAAPLLFIAPLLVYRTAERTQLFMVAGIIFGLVYAGLALFCLNHFMNRIEAINRKLKEETGHVSVRRPMDAAHWFGGRLFYYNRNDPALFVETPVGPSYTLNLAHKLAYVHIAYLAGLAGLIAWVLWIL